ncbi:MAG: hypothetical protein KatS3mg057_3186 [Herpetosiphonaceae bacterium]|nr:MAG: hypothetical protein KatS3mg057_3186 [Herpetosiphonaceae bacterium]
MNTLLLDTDVVSYLLKQDSRAQLFEPYLREQRLALSFMTVPELYQWAAIRKWGQLRIQQLESTLHRYLILPYDIGTCRLWGAVRAACQETGQPISAQDAWVAATALQYDLPLVTHNPTDFQAVPGLRIMTIPAE